MSAEMAVYTMVDSRESERLSLEGPVEYRYGPAETGYATWQNVGSGGACIHLGRYLRPGRRVTLIRSNRSVHDEPVEITGKIAWCRPVDEGKNFLAGIRFDRGGLETCFAISSLVREAHKARLCHLAEQLKLGSPVETW